MSSAITLIFEVVAITNIALIIAIFLELLSKFIITDLSIVSPYYGNKLIAILASIGIFL